MVLRNQIVQAAIHSQHDGSLYSILQFFSKSFHGGLNNNQQIAKERLLDM
jgi:hypothetical protein